jgi:hypothetical protein
MALRVWADFARASDCRVHRPYGPACSRAIASRRQPSACPAGSTGLTTDAPTTKEHAMAKAGRKHMGSGAHGKGSGVGANTEIDKSKLPENMILSNRDKAQHSGERGLDSKQVQTEQLQDHAENRFAED